jgi:hypothetical protein
MMNRLHVESVRRRTISRLTLLFLSLLTTACGTFNLGNVHPQSNKTADQQQLDTLSCKDQATLAVSSAGRQTGDFLLGLTIVGTPVAYELDKAKQRQVFADCMQARGYSVTPPDKNAPPISTAAATSPPPMTPPPGADQLTILLPPGFELKAIPDNLKSVGAKFDATNRTLDIGMVVIPQSHAGVTDIMALASTRRANQADRLKDATFTDVTAVEVGGFKAARYTVTGFSNNVKITYVTTLIEGRDQIVVVSAWAGATNAQQQMTVLESLAATVSGIS